MESYCAFECLFGQLIWLPFSCNQSQFRHPISITACTEGGSQPAAGCGWHTCWLLQSHNNGLGSRSRLGACIWGRLRVGRGRRWAAGHAWWQSRLARRAAFAVRIEQKHLNTEARTLRKAAVNRHFVVVQTPNGQVDHFFIPTPK